MEEIPVQPLTTSTPQNAVQEPVQTPPPIKPQSVKKPFLSKTIIAVFIIVIIFILLPAGTYLFFNSNRKTACTTEAKICPDGSSVGRIGPKCEFAKCPVAKITASPTPTCRPRPACLDATPRCMIPETSDMCPKTPALKIPEYGVQIVLSDEIKDAYYINATASKGYVYLKVHSLDTEAQCKKDDSSTAALSRVGKDEINPMTSGKYSDSFKGKVIENYFYYIDLAQYSCAQTSDGKAKLEKVRSAFTNAEIIQ